MSATIRDRFARVSAPIEPVVPSGIAFDLAIVVGVAGGLTGRVKTFSSADGVDADTELSSAQKKLVSTAFAQALRPSRVYVIGADTTSPSPDESYSDALTAAEELGINFYYVACESRAAADIQDVSNWCATRRKLYLAQFDDLTPTDLQSGGGSDISGDPHTAVVYHPTATEGQDVAILANAAAIPIDTQRPAFTAPTAGVTAYTATDSDVTAAETAHMLIMLPLAPGDTRRLPDPTCLTTFQGERITAIVTKHWVEDRCATALVQQYAQYAAANQGWPGGAAGEVVAESICARVASQGLAAGHLRRREDLPDGYRFDATYDPSTMTITVTGEIGLEDGVVGITVIAPLTRG